MSQKLFKIKETDSQTVEFCEEMKIVTAIFAS